MIDDPKLPQGEEDLPPDTGDTFVVDPVTGAETREEPGPDIFEIED